VAPRGHRGGDHQPGRTLGERRGPVQQDKYFADGYQDCPVFVSMAWNLGRNEWTGSLAAFAVPIAREQLEPGDILLFHNQADPEKGS
jgi:hypothetical protein